MLRALTGRRVGGILVPFNRRDAYKTWWNDASDLMLDLFRSKEVFYYHNLDAVRVGSIGLLDNQAFSARRDGLWAEGDLAEGDLATHAYELALRNAAAWSGGFWPTANTWVIRADGYVERSALVEGSICPAQLVASPPGTTRIEHIRSVPPTIEAVALNAHLERSPFMPPETPIENNNGGTPPPAAPPPAPPPAVVTPVVAPVGRNFTDADLEALAGMLPLRALPIGQTPPPVAVPGTTAYSRFDNVSLLGMLLHDKIFRAYAMANGQFVPRTEEWMRAVGEKMRKLVEKDGNAPAIPFYEGGPAPTPLRAISPQAYQLWHEKVPHLRADELSQSTLVGSGDELVPTLLSSVVWYYFRVESVVLQLFQTFALPSVPFNYPVITAVPTLRLVREPADISQMNWDASVIPSGRPTTAMITFTPGRIGRMFLLSKDLLQASGINTIDAWAQAFVRMMADGIDYQLLNGDELASSSNISYFGADPTNTERDGLLAFDGLREMARDASDTAATATLSADTPSTLSKLMGARGIIGRDIKNLVQIVDPGSAYKYDALDEYEGIDNVGAENATLLNGQVGSVKGVRILVSDQQRNGDSSGRITSTDSGTLGQQVQVHPPGIMIGYLQEMMSDMQILPGRNATAMWGDVAMDIKQMEAGHVAHGYNSTIT